MNELCCVPFCLLCGLTIYTVLGTALILTLTVGMPAIDPGVSQALFLPATGTDPLRSGPKTAVVMYLDPLWELWMWLRP